LRRILPVLRACQERAKRFGEHATVGVLWDFISLPQGLDRTDEEQARFTKGLYAINEWYMHPFTPVLLVTTPLPASAVNKRAYDGRGWCYFERRLASLVKDESMLWDLSLHPEGKRLGYADCKDDLKSSRMPFLSPERVERELREGVKSGALSFTAGLKDLELVSGLYQRGFVKAFESFRSSGGSIIFFTSFGWGTKEVPMLVEAIKYAHEHCRPRDSQMLDLTANAFTPEDKQALREALPDESRFNLDLE